MAGNYFVDDVNKLSDEVGDILDRVYKDPGSSAELEVKGGWKTIRSTLVTDRLDACSIDFLGIEEGSQQESLVRWLTDELGPVGAHVSTQLHEPSGKKEFTDVLLTYDAGTFVIELKALSFLTRLSLPGRSKLNADTKSKIKDARRQLRNVTRKLHEGIPVYDKKSGNELLIERKLPIHAICLVPDLSLIHGAKEFGGTLLREFAARNGDFFHVLDTTQLFRVVQAAHIMGGADKSNRMAAFDSLLIERFKFAATTDVVDFDMAVNLQTSPPRIRFSH